MPTGIFYKKINMRTKSAKFFECKVRYEKMMDDGEKKKVTETYAVDALSFTEAESRIIEEMTPYIGDSELDVTAIAIAPYSEVIFTDSDKADKYYKVRCDFLSINESNGKEKKTAAYYLVQANSVEEARKNMDEAMHGTMIDYTIVSVAETKILDVFEHETT